MVNCMYFYQGNYLHKWIFFRIFAEEKIYLRLWKQLSNPTAVRNLPNSTSRPSAPAQHGQNCASTCPTIRGCGRFSPASGAPSSPSRWPSSSTASAAPEPTTRPYQTIRTGYFQIRQPYCAIRLGYWNIKSTMSIFAAFCALVACCSRMLLTVKGFPNTSVAASATSYHSR